MSDARSNTPKNPALLMPSGDIIFPTPAEANFEIEAEASGPIQVLSNYMLAQAYINDEHRLLTLHCFNLTTNESTLITSFPAKKMDLCDNTLCRDYFALQSSSRQFTVFGPNSTQAIATTPPYPEKTKLTDCKLLPDAKGISALGNDGKQLWLINFTEKNPHWKSITLQDTCVDYSFLNNHSVAMIYEKYPEVRPDYFTTETFRAHYDMAIYLLNFNKLTLTMQKGTLDSSESYTRIFVSPSKNYFALQNGGQSSANLAIWRIQHQPDDTVIQRHLASFGRNFSRVGCSIFSPHFSNNDILFYNEPSGDLVLYDLQNAPHYINTNMQQSSSIMFASPSEFLMRNNTGTFSQYNFNLDWGFLLTVKSTLIDTHKMPAAIADIIIDYTHSLFSPYKKYQADFQAVARKLMSDIKQAEKKLGEDKSKTSAPSPEKQQILAHLQRAVIDKTALDRFIFLTQQNPAEPASAIYKKVLQDFPKISVEIRELLQKSALIHLVQPDVSRLKK